jgi:hypothetical protein
LSDDGAVERALVAFIVIVGLSAVVLTAIGALRLLAA